MSESANSFTSPFESGDWGRWTNLERFSWLRSFHRGIAFVCQRTVRRRGCGYSVHVITTRDIG